MTSKSQVTEEDGLLGSMVVEFSEPTQLPPSVPLNESLKEENDGADNYKGKMGVWNFEPVKYDHSNR